MPLQSYNSLRTFTFVYKHSFKLHRVIINSNNNESFARSFIEKLHLVAIFRTFYFLSKLFHICGLENATYTNEKNLT